MKTSLRLRLSFITTLSIAAVGLAKLPATGTVIVRDGMLPTVDMADKSSRQSLDELKLSNPVLSADRLF